MIEKINTSYGKHLTQLREGKSLFENYMNPYLNKAKDMRESVLTIEELKKKWPAIFPKEREIIIDFGCYYGKFTVELAEKNPEFNILGIDIKYKRVVKTAQLIIDKKLDNALTLIANGLEMLQSIPACSIKGICFFYPDPWPKKRHQRFRVLTSELFSLLNKKLKNNGFIWIKTDNADYYNELCEIKEINLFQKLANIDSVLAESSYKSNFEMIFNNQNKNQYSLILQKN